MHFKSFAVLASLLVSGALAAPMAKRQGGARSFAELSISDGTAGSASAEANAKLPIDTSDLASVTAEQLEILKTERETAEAAETDAFNPAIEAATGDAKTALQNGKIKNKVLKLTFEVAALQVEQAQGEDNAAKIAEEEKKLQNNIGLDEGASGEASTTVDF